MSHSWLQGLGAATRVRHGNCRVGKISCIFSQSCPSYLLSVGWRVSRGESTGMSMPLSRNDAQQIASFPAGGAYKELSRSSDQVATSAPDSERNEAQLISRVRGGDVEAFYELVR